MGPPRGGTRMPRPLCSRLCRCRPPGQGGLAWRWATEVSEAAGPRAQPPCPSPPPLKSERAHAHGPRPRAPPHEFTCTGEKQGSEEAPLWGDRRASAAHRVPAVLRCRGNWRGSGASELAAHPRPRCPSAGTQAPTPRRFSPCGRPSSFAWPRGWGGNEHSKSRGEMCFPLGPGRGCDKVQDPVFPDASPTLDLSHGCRSVWKTPVSSRAPRCAVREVISGPKPAGQDQRSAAFGTIFMN